MSEFAKRKFSELSKDPGSASRLSEPQFSELKMKVSDHHGSFFALSARGDFGGESRGSTPKSVFPCWSALSVPVYSARARNLCNLSHLRSRRLCYILFTGMAAFTSTIAVPAAQLADAPQLEPAFEHLLRNSSVHESIIQTLRVNAITDRDTFVNMFDSEAALKEGASDLGFDLTSGGLPHKREFARVVTSWKTAKVMSETKLQTDAVARAHGVPVTLLPCDWTSLMSQSSRTSMASTFLKTSFPAQSMFENFLRALGRWYTEGRAVVSCCKLV